ncbi:MAG: mevalonate kinase [Anaerolineae bacterium UTCFX2]|jgi:mevalonate kinase|nr:mevalonate kinase [Anaerolineales bacterium]OQY88374.1 MAG: mevalonate kinase [Anaerolineae bacterium UTCFX2]
MPAISASASGKIILFGEHAVVYGRPAIAAPVEQVRARVVVTAEPRRRLGSVLIQTPDLGGQAYLDELPQDDPLGLAMRLTLEHLGVSRPPACTLWVSSTIPIAAGLGSGAAISVALCRAFAEFLGAELPAETVSDLAFEVDRIHHGTPSGIDNTVIAYAQPIFFVRGQPIQLLQPASQFTLIIGDTGVRSPTAAAVGDLRKAWQADPERYEPLFDAAAEIAIRARGWIESGQVQRLGALMDENHVLLCEMGVSSAELDRLVEAARAAGAWGAKLSGGGRGGNMLALAPPERTAAIAESLRQHGATRTITTTVRAHKPPQ